MNAKCPAVVLALFFLSGPALPSTALASKTSRDGAHLWMPDVAARLAELRERSERADAEARKRQKSDRQWWRRSLAPPQLRASR